MKSLRLVHFLNKKVHTTNLFKKFSLLKLPDTVILEICVLICKYFNQALPKTRKNWFTLATASHKHKYHVV